MPREQRTATRKTAVNTTPAGQFKSGIVQSVQYQAVASEKSSGQKLAEGVGLVAKVAQVYGQSEIEKADKRTQIEQRAKGNFEGKEAAREIYLDILDKKIPLEERGQYYFDAITARNKGLGDVHSSYLESYMGALGSRTGMYQDINDEDIMTRKKQESLRYFRDLFSDESQLGTSPHDLLQLIRDSDQLGLSYNESAKFYVSEVAAMIKQNFQEDPNYNWKADVDSKLLIKSADGTVDFGKHPVYGKVIDELQSTLRTQARSNYTNNKATLVAKKRETQSTVLEMSLNFKSPGETLTYLQNNSEGFTVAEYNAEVAALTKFMGTSFNKVNNPDLVYDLKNSIIDGTFNRENLFEAKRELSESDYTAVLKAKSSFDKAIKSESVSQAQKYYNDQVATGKYIAGQEAMFTFTKEGAQQKKRYVELMQSRLQGFLTTEGWEALDVAQISKWSAEVVKIVVPSEGKGVGTPEVPKGGSTGPSKLMPDGFWYDGNGTRLDPQPPIDPNNKDNWD